MTLDPKQLDVLVLGYLDAALGPEEQAALDAALRDDPEVARAVAESALLLSTLRGSAVAGRLLDETRDDATGVPGSDAVWSQLIDEALAARQRHEVEARAERQLKDDRDRAERMRLFDRRRRALDARAAEGTAKPLVIPKWIVLASAAAVALAVVLAIAGVFDPEPKQVARDMNDNNNTPARPDRGERPAVAFVAEVRSSVDARWGGTAHDRPTRLAAGNAVTLTQGLAQVVFDDGAAVIVQAPATFEPYGGNGMRLISGKLTADVPTGAVGFTVQTPGGLITDYGTSFGVIVNHDGQTLAHTFTGRIGLTPTGGGAEVALSAGDVAIADTRGRVRPVEHDALAFVRQDEYVARASAEQDAYARWLAYSYELRRDPALVAFFVPDASTVEDRRLRNLAGQDGEGSTDASVYNLSLATGRFAQRDALRFDQTQSSAYVELDTSMRDLTLAAWVWVEEVPEAFAGLLMCENWLGQVGAVHWQIEGDNGCASVGYRPPGGGEAAKATARTPIPQGRWVHVATVVDSAAGTATTYYDGARVDEQPLDLTVPLRLGEARLGNWNDQVTPGVRRRFVGRMDEVVVLSRAMNGDEVRAMYEQTRHDGAGR